MTERSNKSQALHTKRIDNETDALDNLNPSQNPPRYKGGMGTSTSHAKISWS